MKKKKSILIGVILFILLVGSEGAFFYLYHERSFQRQEQCYERNGQTQTLCSVIHDAADAAYSSATATHILTYLVLFLVFILLVSRLDKVEKLLEELKGPSNV